MIHKINKLFDAGINNIREKQILFNQIEDNPEIIFIKLFNPKLPKPYYEFCFEVFDDNNEYFINEKISCHDLQDYLFAYVREYINKFDNEVKLKISKYYFSKVDIFYNDYKIMHFSFYEHYFKKSSYLQFDDNYYNRLIDKDISILKENYKKLKIWQKYKENPFNMIREEIKSGTKKGKLNKILVITSESFWYLSNKNIIDKEMKRTINEIVENIKFYQKELTKNIEARDMYLKNKNKIEEKIEKFRKLFNAFGYKEIK